MRRNFCPVWVSGFVLSAWLFTAGCAVAPATKPTAGPVAPDEKPPFSYEPLAVHNGCFVEAVHFYDRYFQKERGRERNWAQILEWGNREGDFQVTSGHAVTVFEAKERLWYYDVNYGVHPVDLPVDRRGDITDVAPKIFARYPQFRSILARYRYDFPQQPPTKPADFLFYHANPDVRDATRVASEFGRVRPVRVVEFEVSGAGQKETSAAAAFIFGRRICLYFPRQGTFESPRFLGSLDDLKYLEQVVRHLYPAAANVRFAE